ncbi:MAG TPA: DUF4247 domain-containing protein [Gordonia sp. (in: high G+C Gram-positive bacteria)]|uniref:DUF4247 domain-containing protein n=1 Tax=unclassified Gordonia (in: high G+C Gram-positive bacteria) TaxID=2657482 RepID=UPI0025C2578A|nr:MULTISPECIES: DUF4247 domain-containing protein [unclassified Gordonia (in: high G+C Gram-positive bacteria)]HNP55373.1 DUF4247 domain-containing protein [Gordonia sp. (in: high G+C Gram-positive bacteria)]HRC50055.1 DUF4247 domain-containing protein [Gordonia sp. (in: high G+C Gram-positive bacteria)]
MTFRNGGGSEDPRALLRFMRNALIGIIALVAFAVLVVTCNVDGKPTQPTRTPTYTYPTTSRPTTSSPTTSTSATSEAPTDPGALGALNARDYIEKRYHRKAGLDEGSSLTGYVADGDVATVAEEISQSERPTDTRPGATGYGNVAGSTFLQYPKYIVGLFPYGADKTRVMVSKDYRTGLNHYHGYIGSYWVPTPHYSGRGNSYRGGGSGSGK